MPIQWPHKYTNFSFLFKRAKKKKKRETETNAPFSLFDSESIWSVRKWLKYYKYHV